MSLLIELFDYDELPSISSLGSVEVYEGQNATFSAQVLRASSIQYQVSSDGISWSNVAGAINSSYTISNTSRASHNNKLYRIIATNIHGQRISNIVTLKVWNPLELGSNLVVWMDPTYGLFTERTGASAATPTSNNGLVGTWRARNGSINAVAATDLQRGTYKSTGLNNTPCVDVTSTGSTYNYSGLNSAFRNAKYGYIFAGCTHTNSQGQFRFSIPSRARLAMVFSSGLARISAAHLNADGFDLFTSSSTYYALDEAFVAGNELLWFDADRYSSYSTYPKYIRKNGARRNAAGYSAPHVTDYNITGLSYDIDNTSVYMDLRGKLSHIIAVNPSIALTEQEMRKIEGFINYKLGSIY